MIFKGFEKIFYDRTHTLISRMNYNQLKILLNRELLLFRLSFIGWLQKNITYKRYLYTLVRTIFLLPDMRIVVAIQDLISTNLSRISIIAFKFLRFLNVGFQLIWFPTYPFIVMQHDTFPKKCTNIARTISSGPCQKFWICGPFHSRLQKLWEPEKSHHKMTWNKWELD